MSFRIPRKGPPLTVPEKGDAPFPEPSNYLKKFPVNELPRFPNGPSRRETPFSRAFFYTFPSKAPANEPPLHVPQQGPYGERGFISRANGLFIHSYVKSPPVRSPPTKNGENIWSPSTEPHVDGRPTYNGVRPGSPRGPFTTLRSLTQCHAAFSTIPSTSAWVDQSPVSERVS